jgi:carotenoid 1,2-hydratase
VSSHEQGPVGFDLAVASGGYAWWYLDVVSDDGAYALTVIAFVGSVFSPRYARARRAMDRGGLPADPERHCAINVALYRKQGPKLWALTEQPEFVRTREALTIGRSSMRWRGDHLEVELDERETRFFGRRGGPLRGRIRLYPAAVFGPRIELDRAGSGARHRWYPVAPHARAEVEFDTPALRFSGSGYHDVNTGDEGLERGFAAWTWSRARLDAERTAILYDVQPRQGSADPRGWMFVPKRGAIEELAPATLGPACPLPLTRWRVARAIRSEQGHTPTLLATLEDTPFYSRNLVAVRIAGCETTAVHESLSLDRFASRAVQFLLRFKTTSP